MKAIYKKQIAIKKLIGYIQAGGPEENQYDELSQLWDFIDIEDKRKYTNTEFAVSVEQLFGDDLINQTVQGFGYSKPHGYPGDFEMIDFIYQQKISENKLFQKWDYYFHSQVATIAVRNRKRYFINLVKYKCSKANRPLRILNIASGPCRDLLELFQENSNIKVQIQCVEMDEDAIKYAKSLLGSYGDSIQFTHRNIFRFNTQEKYDLIWSAGLFDYFADKAFIKLLTRMYTWLYLRSVGSGWNYCSAEFRPWKLSMNVGTF